MIKKTDKFSEYQNSNIDILNKVFRNVDLTEDEIKSLQWICGYEKSTVENILSAILKVIEKEKTKNMVQEKIDDSYSIYQLKDGEELRKHRWESLESLKRHGLSIEKENYNLVYTSTMPDTLDMIYEKFNLYHPQDFKGHSLSVSDVVVLHKNGMETAYYVDNFGFEEIEFKDKRKENHLESTEMTVEDNYNMLDGIINNKPSKLEEIKSKGTKTEKNVEDKPLDKEVERER
jgi:hypothetical protein